MAAPRTPRRSHPADFEPIPVDVAYRLAAPLRAYFSPRFYGLSHLHPRHPSLLVGNHTIYGMLDPLLMGAEVYKRRGILVRGLADHAHFAVPVWRDLLRSMGAVDGTRENCAALMRAGQSILVFPGGGREVAKRKGEAYQLIWKQRLGFVRLAVQHRYPITPFASVGPDDAYTILIDANDIMKTPLWRVLQRSGIAHAYLRDGDALMPIAVGLGLSPFPRPERFYFGFGKPIPTEHLDGNTRSTRKMLALRDEVEAAVQAQIAKLKRLRERDQDRGVLRRLLTHW